LEMGSTPLFFLHFFDGDSTKTPLSFFSMSQSFLKGKET
jgi:hypothetical protein